MNTDKTLLAQILTRSYPVTPDELIPLGERIREIEGVYVNLDFKAPAKNNSDYSPGRYDYERAASGKMNARRWVEKRFEPRFPFLNASITTSEGRPLQNDELLSYARGSCEYVTGFALRFYIKSKKKTSQEKATDLKKLDSQLLSFPVFKSRELTDEPFKLFFVINLPINQLIIHTKPVCLRKYELDAVEEILCELIKRLGFNVDCSREYDDEAADLPLDIMFTSQDLNTLIPSKKEAFTRKLLCHID